MGKRLAWRVRVELTYWDDSRGSYTAHVHAYDEHSACALAEGQACREALNADEIRFADAGEAVVL